MKITDKFIENINANKIIHILIGYIIVSLGFPYNFDLVNVIAIIAILVVIFKNYIHNKVNDKFDNSNIIFDLLGIAIGYFYYLINFIIL